MPRIAAALVALALAGCAAPRELRPQDVLAAFAAAGLEAEAPRRMGRADYGVAPYLGEEAYRFGLPFLCPNCGGRIFSVRDGAERARLKAFYDDLGKTSAEFASHTYTKGTILVQLNGTMEKSLADRYGAVLEGLE